MFANAAFVAEPLFLFFVTLPRRPHFDESLALEWHQNGILIFFWLTPTLYYFFTYLYNYFFTIRNCGCFLAQLWLQLLQLWLQLLRLWLLVPVVACSYRRNFCNYRRNFHRHTSFVAVPIGNNVAGCLQLTAHLAHVLRGASKRLSEEIVPRPCAALCRA